MQKHDQLIKAVKIASEELGLKSLYLHKDQIAFRVVLNGKNFDFINHHNPFDNESKYYLLKDKDLTYNLLKKFVLIPRWKAYLDPETKIGRRKIVDDVLKNFSMPLCIKMNRGSRKRNVFIAKNEQEVINAVNSIFNKNSRYYDYLLLAQEFIKFVDEFRVICWKGKILLTYKKWKKAEIVTDEKIINQLQEITKTASKVLEVNFMGCDIALSKDGKYYLFECNKSPMFDAFVKYNGNEKLIEIIKEIFNEIQTKNGQFDNSTKKSN